MTTMGKITSGSSVPTAPANFSGGCGMTAKMAGQFQTLLTRQLPGEKHADSGLDQLLALLSGMNAEQLGQLIALLGLPQANPLQPETIDLAAAEAGKQLVCVDVPQLARAVAEWLQNAGIPLEDAIRSLTASNEKGAKVKEANEQAVKLGGQLLHLLKSIQQAGRSEDQKISGASLQSAALLRAEIRPLRQPETLFLQMGSRLRPELTAIVGDSGGEPKLTATQTVPPEPVVVQGHPSAAARQDISSQTDGVHLSSVSNWVVPAEVSGSTASGAVASSGPVHVQMRADQWKADFPALLVKQAVLGERHGVSEMRITLLPDGLGEIQVHIQGEAGQVTLQIAADSQYARSLLDSGIGVLKQQLEAQGLQVNRLEVVPVSSSTGSDAELGMFDGQRQQRHPQTYNPRKGQVAKTGVIEEAAVWEPSWQSLRNGQFDMMA
ncbi:flagellar hook-length control protein FliK [Effusibacillus pohliae]|uniref:flagellar hook-length control protein FliK n=1 Tax=Effusibacillus pohliae TaxID=232270 RepID=UPI000375AB0F|nr:flagellar hook-length control protein FliK [Effusibacillus pohliae]